MKKLLLVFALLLNVVWANAQGWSGSGAGTENDPYLIFNPIQLDQVRNFLGMPDVYFKMMSDVDVSEYISDNNPTQGWQPIGTPSEAFKGVFDGNGKTISNLTYEGSVYGGMFGVLCGEVYNLNLIDASITTNKDKSGILCGYCGTGDIITGYVHGCKITGTLTVDNNTIGGVAGCMCGGEIYECDVDAKITQIGTGRQQQVLCRWYRRLR